MFIITVLYPADGSLDMDYYRETHLPLVRRLLDPAGLRELVYWQPARDDAAAPFQLVAELRFADRESGLAALAAHGAETQADIGNFTSLKPVIMTGDLEAG